MPASVYKINKGINRSVEFRGLKAQWIWWLGGGLLVVLLIFALLYLSGVNSWCCVGFALVAGTGIFLGVYRLSKTFGEHGLRKKLAQRRIPASISCRSRRIYLSPKKKIVS